MDLITNGVVISDAIKFVQTNKERLTKNEDDKMPDKRDYSEDEDQVQEEQGQEGKTPDQGITNTVF
jgi:hypothetical protein